MSSAKIAFDHVHLISRDSEAAASWYQEMLGGKIVARREAQGSVQLRVAFDGATVMVRGPRTGEQPGDRSQFQWGMDHFAFQVDGDFDGFCDGLREKGVKFTTDPTNPNPGVRIAYIEAPDGVSIELLQRKK